MAGNMCRIFAGFFCPPFCLACLNFFQLGKLSSTTARCRIKGVCGFDQCHFGRCICQIDIIATDG